MPIAEREREREVWPRFLSAIAVFPFAVSSLVLPWGRDQGIYAHAASRLLDGQPLYSGIFAFKPPMTVLMHAAAMECFGRNMLAIRLFDLGWTLATGQVLYTLGRRLGTPATGILAAGFYAFSAHSLGYWDSAQTDGWATLPCALALAALTGGADRGASETRFAGAGFFLGAAVWFKYSFAAMALPLAVAAAAGSGLRGWRALLRQSLVGIAGFAAFSALICGWLVEAGSWGAFVEIQRDVLAPYVGAVHAAHIDPVSHFLRNLFRVGPLLPPLAMLGAVGLVRGGAAGGRPLAWAAVAWALAGLGSTASQGKFFDYQYGSWLGPAALLAAVGVSASAGVLAERFWLPLRARFGAAPPRERQVPAGTSTGAVTAALLPLLALAAPPFAERLPQLLRVVSGRSSLEAEWRVEGRYQATSMSLADNLALSHWLRDRTPTGAPIFLWAYDPMVYVLGDRAMTSRFPYAYPLVVPWAPAAFRAEFLSEFDANPPSAFIVGSGDATPSVTGLDADSAATFAAFTELHQRIDRDYVAVHDPAIPSRFAVFRRVRE